MDGINTTDQNSVLQTEMTQHQAAFQQQENIMTILRWKSRFTEIILNISSFQLKWFWQIRNDHWATKLLLKSCRFKGWAVKLPCISQTSQGVTSTYGTQWLFMGKLYWQILNYKQWHSRHCSYLCIPDKHSPQKLNLSVQNSLEGIKHTEKGFRRINLCTNTSHDVHLAKVTFCLHKN